LIVNPGFEEPLDQEKNVWKFDGKDLNVFKVVPGAGGNGSRALLCKRPDQDEKLYWATQQVNNITSGANFVLKCKIKVTGSNGKESAKFGFTGNLQRTLVGDCDWTEYEVICTSSDRKIYPTFSALSGEVSYDDIRLQEFNGTWFVGMLNPYNRIEDNERIMYFTATCQGQHVYTKTATPDIAVLIEVQNQSGETVLSACRRIVDNRFCVDGSKLADGIYKLKISFIDLANKSIFDRAFRPLYVGTSKLPKAPAKGVVTIDKLGRTLIDGKPFMPLAIHTAGVGRQYDVKYFANSPFNAVLVYSGYSDLYMREYKGYGVAGTLKSLDMMHKNGLKVIFGFPFTYEEHMKEFRTQMQRWGFPDNLSAEEYIGKVVDEVRNHPAILAYYSTDEISHLRAAELMSHRDVINAHDPYHPTYAGIWQHFAFPYFSGTFDVLGINLYPIQGKDKPQEQPQLPLWINKAHKVWDRPDTLAVPLWATHQLFSGSLIDDPRKDLKNYRFPTEMELLSMTLMSAIHGAKGFVYYYWNCVLYSCGSTLDEKCETFQPHWRDICRALTEVRELEPFIVSTAPAPKVTVNNIKGITYARAFVDEEYGRIRVLISAEGPGEAEAEIKIEDFPIPLGAHDNLLRSKYNKTSRIDKNTYIFKGREVDCDILQRWPEYELDKPIIEMEKERKEKAGK